MPALQLFRQYVTRVLIIFGLSILIFLPRPLLGRWYLTRAIKFEFVGQFEQAALAYEEAAIRCWWEHGLVEKAAFSALNAGDDLDAIILFTRVLESGELTDFGRITLGKLLSEVGEPEQALEIWSGISTNSEYEFTGLINRAAVEADLGNY